MEIALSIVDRSDGPQNNGTAKVPYGLWIYQNSGMSAKAKDRAIDLCRYIDASPSPYHAVDESVRRLQTSGFSEIYRDDTRSKPGRWYLRSGGALLAWVDEGRPPSAPVSIVGAHTDSPNLRAKPRPNRGSHGYQQVGVEVYGSVLLNSWLDRDLGISGRIAIRDGTSWSEVLIHEDRPIARIPQLAIHLDRGVNEKGLIVDPQDDLAPVIGLGDRSIDGFETLLASVAGIHNSEILSWDIMFHAIQSSVMAGPNEEFISAPRLDNLLSCHAGTEALIEVASADNCRVPVLALFDHEEVGSTSVAGACGPLLNHVLQTHILISERAVNSSIVLSTDGAHATHPSRGHRHDPEHDVQLNGGPVVKFNANSRYATDVAGLAEVRLAAERAGVFLQYFVSRNDLPCGSTIGPLTAAQTGLRTVDLGVAQLAMHSAREFCGSEDPGALHSLLLELLSY